MLKDSVCRIWKESHKQMYKNSIQLFQIARKFFIKLENFENLICLVIAVRRTIVNCQQQAMTTVEQNQ